jgi:hypothetical protein
MLTPYYQFEYVEAQREEPGVPGGSPAQWRVVVWDAQCL